MLLVLFSRYQHTDSLLLNGAAMRALCRHAVSFARGVVASIFSAPFIRVPQIRFDGVALALLTLPPSARVKMHRLGFALVTFHLLCAWHDPSSCGPGENVIIFARGTQCNL